jgi:hypothetical protein
MIKPFQNLTADEVSRVSRVEAVKVIDSGEMSSWDVTLHCLATATPLAHDVLNLDKPDAVAISQYIDFVLARIGLRMLEPLEPSGELVSRCVARVSRRDTAK